MLKLYLADNEGTYKTTKILKRYWEENPDIELNCDPYWNPLKAEKADVIWVEWTEGAAQRASERKGFYPGVVSDHVQQPDKDYNWEGKILINRMIDIDAYYGHYRGVAWQNVDYLAYIAKHVFEMVNKEVKFAETFPKLKTVHIPLTIDLNEWTYRKRDGLNRKIAWISEIWSGKGLPLMLQAFRRLLDLHPNGGWELHVVGRWSTEAWQKPFIDHYVAELKLQDNVKFFDRVESIDKFLEGYDYLVSSSYKEAFSLIIAEAMAKGIKTLTHNWKGAKDIWPEEMVWTTVEEFANKMLLGDYNSEKYRALAELHDKKFEITAANKMMNLC